MAGVPSPREPLRDRSPTPTETEAMTVADERRWAVKDDPCYRLTVTPIQEPAVVVYLTLTEICRLANKTIEVASIGTQRPCSQTVRVGRTRIRLERVRE